MSVRPFIILSASFLSVLVPGCDDGLSPKQVHGTYVLEQVGDDPMPSVIFQGPQGTVRIIADTLLLGANGRGRFLRIQAIEVTEANPLPTEPTRLESALQYRVEGSRVEIVYVCPINALCTAGPHLIGRRYGDRMLIEDALITEDVRYYRRVGPLGGS